MTPFSSSPRESSTDRVLVRSFCHTALLVLRLSLHSLLQPGAAGLLPEVCVLCVPLGQKAWGGRAGASALGRGRTGGLPLKRAVPTGAAVRGGFLRRMQGSRSRGSRSRGSRSRAERVSVESSRTRAVKQEGPQSKAGRGNTWQPIRISVCVAF